VADVNPAALEPIRATLGVAECLTDPLQLIDVVEADAIIVATLAVSHVEIGVRALAKNLSSVAREARCAVSDIRRSAPRGHAQLL
jgi:predicted dehydrogenase